MFNASGLNAQQITGTVQSILARHRDSLQLLAGMYAWSSGVSNAELVAVGFSSTDAATLQGAIADAHAEYLIHTTGQAPSGYPQVTGTPYVYQASQNQVIGPQ